MYSLHDRVKSKESGVIYRVAAPLSNGEDKVAVWQDSSCKTLILLDFENVEPTKEELLEVPNARIIIDVKQNSKDETSLVTRTVDAQGMQPLIAAYSDFRNFMEEVTEMPIKDLDAFLEGAETKEA